MLPVYAAVSVKEARDALADGFTDLYSRGDEAGVLVGLQPVGAAGGYEGDVALVTEVPVDESDAYEEVGPAPGGTHDVRTGHAYVPAAVLNRCGRPRVYGHPDVGTSRRDLVIRIRALEAAGDAGLAAQMRGVMEFFDEVGWRTSLKAQGQPGR